MLVLHVGPHKTGTTYIQKNLEAAGRKLASLGWDYPTVATSHAPIAHHPLAYNPTAYLTPGTPEHQELKACADDARARNRNVILSAEGFCSWTAESYRLLGKLFGEETVDVVYTIRDPVNTFYSFWAEEVKQGYTYSLPVRFSHMFNDPIRARLLNPMIDLAGPLQADDVRVHVIPYEVLKTQERDIYEHLCSTVLRLNLTAQAKSRENQSFPIELTEFLRLCMLVHGNGERNVGPGFRNRFMANTTPDQRKGFADVMRQHGGSARAVINVPRKSFYKTHIERIVTEGLSSSFTIPVTEEDPLLTDCDQYLLYYDEFQCWRTKAIRDAVEEAINGIYGVTSGREG